MIKNLIKNRKYYCTFIRGFIEVCIFLNKIVSEVLEHLVNLDEVVVAKDLLRGGAPYEGTRLVR